jgi:hypothetical protein
MFISIVLLIFNQNELCDPQKISQFADYLYQSCEYTAALQEYRRYSFLVDTISNRMHQSIIDCYLQTGSYAHALDEADLLRDSDRIPYIKGYILYNAHLYDSSRVYLEHAELPYNKDAHILIGLSYVQEFKFENAARYIDVPSPLPVYKRPVTGALFSLFPGGGHFYCNRIGDGFFSFAVVGLSAALAYYYHSRNEDLKFALSLSAAVIFYAGNIYGGVNAVRNYNYYLNDTYRCAILDSIKPVDPFAH